jgi:hypothetical protein
VILLAGGGRVAGQRGHRGTGWDGPLWGAREGDRCALALISLALDEGDATAVLDVASRFAGVAMSVAARVMLRVSAFPRRRGRRPWRSNVPVSPAPTNQARTQSPKQAPDAQIADSRAQPEGWGEARLHRRSRSRRTGAAVVPARLIPGERRVAEALIRSGSQRSQSRRCARQSSTARTLSMSLRGKRYRTSVLLGSRMKASNAVKSLKWNCAPKVKLICASASIAPVGVAADELTLKLVECREKSSSVLVRVVGDEEFCGNAAFSHLRYGGTTHLFDRRASFALPGHGIPRTHPKQSGLHENGGSGVADERSNQRASDRHWDQELTGDSAVVGRGAAKQSRAAALPQGCRIDVATDIAVNRAPDLEARVRDRERTDSTSERREAYLSAQDRYGACAACDRATARRCRRA